MGRYYNPEGEKPTQEAALKVGRALQSGDYDQLIVQLRGGEALSLWLDRGFFQQIADVTDKREFEAFAALSGTAHVISSRFFAIPSDLFFPPLD